MTNEDFENAISSAKEWAEEVVRESRLTNWTDIYIRSHKLKKLGEGMDEQNKAILDMRVLHLLLIAKKLEEVESSNRKKA